MKDKMKVSDFYDAFTNYQMETDVMLNDRHFILFKKLKSLGLNTNSHVLELGCGIGVITSLIATVVRKGKITAVDISPKSIEVSKKKIFQKTNIEFIVSDILNFSYPDNRFDFITLFDVIEHIPLKDHSAVFKLISRYMNEKT
ncbi:MAG: class I SAM-dependent methyltransferase, partial [Bacteroidota bacterium]